jgi:hypothetical protein
MNLRFGEYPLFDFFPIGVHPLDWGKTLSPTLGIALRPGKIQGRTSSFACYPAHVQEKLVDLRPGLTGPGFLVFRDEEAVLERVRRMGKDPVTCYAESALLHPQASHADDGEP